MRLKVGDAAPGFALDSVNRGAVSLEALRGDAVLLVFGRYFGCPVCQYDFEQLMGIQEKVMEKARIVYLIQSTPESARAFIEGMDVMFPVVPVPETDGEYRVYDDYGVGRMSVGTLVAVLRRSREAGRAGKKHGSHEGTETQSPADFVVDGSGIIRRAYYGLFEPEDVLGALGRLI